MTDQPIELKLAGHVFRFTRRSWGEDVRFAVEHPEATRTDYTAFGLVSVDGVPVDYAKSNVILQALPKPIRERVVLYYLGSLPGRRKFTVEMPYEAPQVQAYMRRAEKEQAAVSSNEDDLLNRTFGEDEVQEAHELSLQMAEGTHYAGRTAAHGPQTSASFEENPGDFGESAVPGGRGPQTSASFRKNQGDFGHFVGSAAHEPQTSASFRENPGDFDESPVNYHAVVTE